MLSRWQRYLRAHPRAIDVIVALVPVFISFPGITVSVDGAPIPAPRWPGYLLTGIACAALVWARSRPRATAVVTVACAAALAALGYTLSPLLLAPAMVALFFVALRTSQKTAYAIAAAAIAVLVCTALIASPTGEGLAQETIGTAAWLLLPVALGITARLRAAYMEAADARAEYAERTREEEARHRVADERMRIARELHDVTAHHLALANAQAGTVIYLMDTEPGKARTMAGDLNGTIVAALEELKATVGLLRQAGDPESPLEPAPGWRSCPPWPSRSAPPGSPSPSPPTANRSRCLRAQTSPRSASSRKHSPMSPSTPAPAMPRCDWPIPATGWASRSPTTAPVTRPEPLPRPRVPATA